MAGTRRIRRYVFRELVGPTLVGLSLYTFVLLMNAFFLVARTAISRNLGADIVGKLFLYEVPKILVLTIPMAVLFGTLIAVGRLSADHETVALEGAGFGPMVLLRPILLHGTIAALVSFCVFAFFVPHASYQARILNGKILASSGFATNLAPRVFYTDLPGYMLFVDEIRAGSEGRLETVLVEQSGEGGKGPDFLFLAKDGDLYPDPDGSGKLLADLRNGVCHVYRERSPQSYQVSRFGRYLLPIEPPAHLRALAEPPQRALSDLPLADLLRERAKAADSKDSLLRTYRVRAADVQIHTRFALPFACLLFAILGLPLGKARVRSGKGAGFALSVAVFLVYYVVFTAARDQASQGRVPVPLGVWSGNIVTAVWAALALPRMDPRRQAWIPSLGSALRRLGEGAFSWLARRRSASTRAPEASRWSASPSYRVVGLIDRHIAIHYVRMLGYALLSTYTVFAVVELRDLLDGVVQNHRPLSMVLEYFRYFAPGKLGVILPISCLAGAVVAFTILAHNGELTAMKAGGVSMRRATVPVLLVTLGLCGLLFLVQEHVTPVANQRAQETRDRILGKPPRTYGVSLGGRWTFGSGNRLYHYRVYDPDREQFQGLSVFTLDRREPRILDHRFAAVARWGGRSWTLERGWYRSFPAGGEAVVFRKFDTEDAVLDPPENFARREISLTVGGDLPEQMSIAELSRQIEALEDSGYDTTRLQVAFYSKLAHPLTPIVMVLLGLPFAFRVGRRGSLYGIGVALLLVIVYWATFAIFNALGFETILPPLVAAWAPNVLYALFGVYLLLFVRT